MGPPARRTYANRLQPRGPRSRYVWSSANKAPDVCHEQVPFEIERLHGERLAWMSCDATDVRLGAIAREIERLHGEWLVLMCCDATDVRLERLPVESSVCIVNSWV